MDQPLLYHITAVKKPQPPLYVALKLPHFPPKFVEAHTKAVSLPQPPLYVAQQMQVLKF